MIHDFFAFLLATFVIGPVQTEINERMQAAQAPLAVVQQVQACVTSATPTLIERAGNDPWWGLTTTIGVAVGFTDAPSVLAGASPSCAAAVAAARPFLAAS